MSGPKFKLEHQVEYGDAERLSPSIERVTAANPSKFTFVGTGTYLVGDRDRVVIIDPGPPDDSHVDALVAAVDGRAVSHLLITHTHGDHSPAAAILQTHFDAPTCGFGPHPLPRPDPDATPDPAEGFGFDPIDPDTDPDSGTQTGDADPAADPDAGDYRSEHAHDWDFVPDVKLADGEILDCDGMRFEAIHTPGHISNHLCFGLLDEQVLFSGDHVMGWSTTIIPPPDGSLNDYMASLERLFERTESVYYPTHGSPVTDPLDFVTALHRHRESRTQQILDCLDHGIDTIKEMVLQMYTHVDPKLYNAAGASVMSHLVALCETGAVYTNDPEPKPSGSYFLSGP